MEETPVTKNADGIIQSYLDNSLYAHLAKKVIALPGRTEPYIAPRKMILIEACGSFDFKRGILVNRIMKDKAIDPETRLFLFSTYCSLAPYSFGDVPTCEEFGVMLDTDIAIWIEGMKEVNPDKMKMFDSSPSEMQQMLNELFISIDGEEAPSPEKAPSEQDLREEQKQEIKKKSRKRAK